MLADLGLVALGIAVGTFGTLIGAGGGFVLVPLLALLEPSAPTAQITAVSLAVVALNASSGAIAYARQGRVDFRSGVPFAIATIPGSLLGVAFTYVAARSLFDVILATLLIALGIFVMARHNDAPLTQARRPTNMPLGIGLSAGVGFVASFFGVGGGPIHVPAMIGILRFPPHIATATSQFVLAVMAIVATAVHIAAGDLSDHWDQVVFVGGGAIVGAQLGARLSTRVRGAVIVRALALALVFVGLRLGAQAVLHV